MENKLLEALLCVPMILAGVTYAVGMTGELVCNIFDRR